MGLIIWVGKIVDFWEAFQVELHGWYSAERVHTLVDYSERTSTFRALLVLFVMPWPSIVLTIFVDLIPLCSPSEGLQVNYLFSLRTFLAYCIVNAAMYLQFRHTVPTTPLPNGRLALASVSTSILTTGFAYLLSSSIGFPLPFTMLTISPACISFLFAPLLQWLKRARNDPEIWLRVINTITLWTTQEFLMLIYPLYFYIFTTLPSSAKMPFTFLLPIMKIFLRNMMARTVVHMNDEIPEVVLMNVEVFNSLFMSYCMQNTPSIWTTLGLIAIDGVQMMASMHDVGSVIRRLDVIKERVTAEHERQMQSQNIDDPPLTLRRKTILVYTLDILNRYKMTSSPQIAVCDSHSQGSQLPPKVKKNSTTSSDLAGEKKAPRFNLGKVFVAQESDAVEGNTDIGTLEPEYALQVRKVLYITEFVILINYVEVIIPIIFSTNLLAMYYLPNRVYYAQIVNMNVEQLRDTIGNVMLYCFLQLVSLVILFFVLWRKLHISGLRQLAFVLEKQADQVQVKIVLWVFCNVQATLQHFGFDYSFAFAWLKGTAS